MFTCARIPGNVKRKIISAKLIRGKYNTMRHLIYGIHIFVFVCILSGCFFEWMVWGNSIQSALLSYTQRTLWHKHHKYAWTPQAITQAFPHNTTAPIYRFHTHMLYIGKSNCMKPHHITPHIFFMSERRKWVYACVLAIFTNFLLSFSPGTIGVIINVSFLYTLSF